MPDESTVAPEILGAWEGSLGRLCDERCRRMAAGPETWLWPVELSEAGKWQASS